MEKEAGRLPQKGKKTKSLHMQMKLKISINSTFIRVSLTPRMAGRKKTPRQRREHVQISPFIFIYGGIIGRAVWREASVVPRSGPNQVGAHTYGP